MASAGATASSTAAAAATTAAAAATTAATAARASAAAHRLGVGIADDESASHQAFHVVDVGAVEQRSAVGVDQNLDRVRVDDEIVIGGLGLDAEHVLQATVGAGHDYDSQHAFFRALLVQNLFELVRSHRADIKDLRSRQFPPPNFGRFTYSSRLARLGHASMAHGDSQGNCREYHC